MREIRMDVIHGNIEETITSLMNMNYIARRRGLLALEELLAEPFQLPLMVRVGLTLVIDGIDEADIEEILSNLMGAGDLNSAEDMKEAKVIKQGLLSLRRGENPMIFLPKLVSHLGFELYCQYVIHNGYTNRQEKVWIYGQYYGDKDGSSEVKNMNSGS